MPVYRVTIEGKEYTVEVLNPRERPVRAIVDGEVIEVAVEAGAMAAAAPTPLIAPAIVPTPAPIGAGAPGEVKAPLPGTVVSVSVSAGDKVEYGQELCVLEAMKMNNPIRSARVGTVKEVFISVGDRVQYGTLLLVIED